MKTLRIHPTDVFRLMETTTVLMKFKKPWWSFLIPGFNGPYKGIVIINGLQYEQDVNAPILFRGDTK